MTEEQKAFLECYRISAEFCSRSNEGKERISYNHNDIHNIAKQIAQVIGIIN